VACGVVACFVLGTADALGGSGPAAATGSSRAALGGVDTAAVAEAAARARRAARPRPRGHLTTALPPGTSVPLRSSPNGPALGTVDGRTEFGSPTILHVAERRGRWLGVTTAEVPNGRLGWIDGRKSGLRLSRVRWSVHVDRSAGRLELRRGGRRVRSMPVGVGRPGSPTPVGRFAVTDKLPGGRWSSAAYGCCVLALAASQPNVPAGWRNGNRMAIHGTGDESKVGRKSSAGCLNARAGDVQALMRTLPLGTAVFIRR